MSGRWLLAVCAAGALWASSATAASVTFELDYTFSGTSPTGPAPWLRATFTDYPGGDAVQLKLESLLDGAGEFLGSKGWYFNLNPTRDPTSLTFTLLSGDGADDILLGRNAYRAGGDGYFDIELQWSASGDGRFTAGETALYAISAVGLTAEDFLARSIKKLSRGRTAETPYYSAAHVQGIDLACSYKDKCDDQSGWIGAKDYRLDPSAVVPLPAGLWLLGAGLVGYLGLARGRRAAA